ncbi:30S ribosomal protein S2 [Candidatus Uhrbacteria bacterium]|nr:30S ribosomal protein S2 [Candidatus Uhrbacteria bacterium]
MATIPALAELLEAGVHFGHRVSKRHPKMQPYLFGSRNDISIINLEETRTKLAAACDAVRALAAEGKTILFVGTKDQARSMVQSAADRVGMPHVTGRWLGGTITNFAIIGKLIQKYRGLCRQRDTGELQQKYTKFEQGELLKEIDRLADAVGGIAELNRIPDAIFVVDICEEEIAIREANRSGVTTFAICDSNVDPTTVTYPIPGNDDAVSAVSLLVRVFTDAVADGIQERARTMASSAPTPSAKIAESEPVIVVPEPTVVAEEEDGDAVAA